MHLVSQRLPRALVRRRACGGRRARFLLAYLVGALAPAASAQELVPAAYTPSPTGVNLLTLGSGYSSGSLTFDPSLPVEDVSAGIGALSVGYARTFGLFGRSANVTALAGYLVGNIDGIYLGEYTEVHRSGLADAALRFGVNLIGAPAMDPAAFRSYRPGTLLGASLMVRAPTGQYDPSKLINIGTHRWAFKPEVGVVHTTGNWSLEASLGGWLFTDNNDYNGGKTRAQDAILSTEAHARLTVSPALWASIDGNFWVGGKTSVNGAAHDDLQRNSRVGLTLAWRVAPGHGLRFAASRGAFTRIGGDFTSVGVSYSRSWI
jgi:hypothetical protein